MKGYLIKFYMEQKRQYQGKALFQWLIDCAKQLQIHGATVTSAIASIGRDDEYHSSHFFELSDQPIQVEIIVNEQQSQQLFALLQQQSFSLFYIKVPIEYGSLGRGA